MGLIKGICFHWSAGSPHATVADIRRLHVQGNGWRDIGYHRVILSPESDQFKGKKPPTEWYQLVKQGRTLDDDQWLVGDEVGAAAKGFNSSHVMVCVVSSPSHALATLQKKAIYQTARTLANRYGLSAQSITTHQRLNPTACPGPEIEGIIKVINRVGLEHPEGPGGPVYGQ